MSRLLQPVGLFKNVVLFSFSTSHSHIQGGRLCWRVLFGVFFLGGGGGLGFFLVLFCFRLFVSLILFVFCFYLVLGFFGGPVSGHL